MTMAKKRAAKRRAAKKAAKMQPAAKASKKRPGAKVAAKVKAGVKNRRGRRIKRRQTVIEKVKEFIGME
jgi:hypothetical protein